MTKDEGFGSINMSEVTNKRSSQSSDTSHGAVTTPIRTFAREPNKILLLVLAVSSGAHVVHMMNNQTVLQTTLSSSAPQNACIKLSSSTGEPSSTNHSLEPIRFIAVGGPYHTGSTNLWYSIDKNIANGVAASKNITLGVFPGGYPPCGVPLLQNFDVDMERFSGNISGVSDQNIQLFDEWGTMWNDWKSSVSIREKKSPVFHLGSLDSPAANIKAELPPHKNNKFYSWWKHTPPQHPMINCFRSDTLYVIMVRHPVAWKKSTMKQRYDLKYDRRKQLWILDRKSPRCLPMFEMQFKSLYHVWAYYMNGYLGWESVSAGKNCYDKDSLHDTDNCLGGENMITSGRRNMILVRQEDYSHDPQKVLAGIFAFATRGIIDAEEDKHLFVTSEEASKHTNYTEEMNKKAKSGYFAEKDSEWEGANKLRGLCKRLGYSCDESPSIFDQ